MSSVYKLPKAVRQLIEKFERLPGIGPKSAQRLVFYLLHNPEHELQDFADKLTALKANTVICEVTHNVCEENPDPLYTDPNRDRTQLCIVEQPLDVMALERSEHYIGLYHVLHGVIAPLNNIGPDQLFIHDIIARLQKDPISELIIATNPTMEGEATGLYIKEMIEQDGRFAHVSITRIGHGLPVGADIEYADGVTLSRAMKGRTTL